MNFESLELEFQFYAERLQFQNVWLCLTNTRRDSLMSDDKKGKSLIHLKNELDIKVPQEIWDFVVKVFNTVNEKAIVRLGSTAGVILDWIDSAVVSSMLVRSHKTFSRLGIEPKTIDTKSAVTILKAASVEDDEFLKEMWQNLFNSAVADGSVHPDSLKIASNEIDSLDAKILESTYQLTRNGNALVIEVAHFIRSNWQDFDNDILTEKIQIMEETKLLNRPGSDLFDGGVKPIEMTDSLELTHRSERLLKTIHKLE